MVVGQSIVSLIPLCAFGKGVDGMCKRFCQGPAYACLSVTERAVSVFLLVVASGPVSLPANPADISPEHLHDFLSMASSPPLPSFVQPPPDVSLPTAESPSRASPDAADSGLPMTGSSDDSSPPSFAQAS